MPRLTDTFEAKVFFLTIAVSFCIIYFFVLTQLGKSFDFVKNRISAKNAYKEMKPGDLVVVSYNSLRGKLVKVFTGSAWVHSGLVVEDQGERFIVEVAYYDKDKEGVLFTPVKEWFDFNHSRVLGWREYNGVKKFPNKTAVEMIKRDSKREITPDMNAVSWLRTMYKSQHNDPGYGDRDSFFCSEYIIHVLQTLGIIAGYRDSQGFNPCGYKPWELFYGQLPLKKGASYGQSYMIHG